MSIDSEDFFQDLFPSSHDPQTSLIVGGSRVRSPSSVEAKKLPYCMKVKDYILGLLGGSGDIFGIDDDDDFGRWGLDSGMKKENTQQLELTTRHLRRRRRPDLLHPPRSPSLDRRLPLPHPRSNSPPLHCCFPLDHHPRNPMWTEESSWSGDDSCTDSLIGGRRGRDMFGFREEEEEEKKEDEEEDNMLMGFVSFPSLLSIFTWNNAKLTTCYSAKPTTKCIQ
ncbi:hypothetical protein BVC80_9095g12 [Macleaya cordata]|uniref:Uncharacterized protein n=1 Tax=Macleaya cordata TaxID=56857 RepID=A0A200PX53_MACCD|nr:hypothetical protein BVC80_9095g12 [Macleaya cordata]